MKLDFRQGIVKHQTDTFGNPSYLSLSGSTVSLVVSPTATLLTFAHGPSNYLFTESQSVNNAWSGPFTVGADYWLYWDIDLLTGIRTFGHTLLSPINQGIAPVAPLIDQHWFDTTRATMFVWSGSRWIEKIRIFAGKLENGSVLHPNSVGSTGGLANTPSSAGFILYDDESNPVKRFHRLGKGHFLTTESPINSQFARAANFKLEAALFEAEVMESIPKYSTVSLTGPRQISLASSTDVMEAVGIAMEDLNTGEVSTFIRGGLITEENNWNWTEPAGTPVFVGPTGALTTAVPQSFSMQRAGTIVSPTQIFVNLEEMIILINS